VLSGLRGGKLSGAISHGHRAYGVAEVSTTLGLSKGTVSRYLLRLESAGLLVRLPDRKYTLSPRVYHWGQAAKPGADIQTQARPIMEGLANRFGEPVSLFVLASGVAVCIDQVDGLHPVRLNASIGRQLPLHTGASPRLLLAYAPTDIQEAVLAEEPFPRMGPATLTTGEELRVELARTRERGYVVSVGESNEGVIGIAAPVLDASGQVVAALSIAGLETRLRSPLREECLSSVRSAANEVSEALGFLSSKFLSTGS
jgi:DNA-binding IclR family transcriptional regulator